MEIKILISIFIIIPIIALFSFCIKIWWDFNKWIVIGAFFMCVLVMYLGVK